MQDECTEDDWLIDIISISDHMIVRGIFEKRTHIANVDADIHESDVIGECKVDKSLEIRVRRHLLVASQSLPNIITAWFSMQPTCQNACPTKNPRMPQIA